MKELTQATIEKWVALADGKFSLRDIREELRIESEENRGHLRTIMRRLVGKGLVASDGRDGTYRKLDYECEAIDLESANPANVLRLAWPFGIENYARIYPKSIIIVAGDKNSGKTALMYTFLKLNMGGDMPMDLYNSETGGEQMRERFEAVGIPIPPSFGTWQRYDNFADVIKPDSISVIDYLDFNSEVYLVGDEIDRIFRKLKNGIALIGLQKPPPVVTFVKGQKQVSNRDLGYGGGFSAKRAALYLSMSENRLKLLYVKAPTKDSVNPNNMTWNFRIGKNGVDFLNIRRGDVPDDLQGVF